MEKKHKEDIMKIFLMDIIEPSRGGSPTIHKLELIRNLSGLGHEIHIITSEDINIDAVHVHPFKNKKRQGFWGLLYQLRHVMRLLKLIRTHHFDILCTRNISIGILGYITRKRGTKLVFEMNGISPFERKQNQLKEEGFIKSRIENIRIAWLKYIELFFAKRADAIIAVTEEIKKYLVNHRIEEDKIKVIENGANTELFRPIKDKEILNELKNKLSINNDENVVIYAGGLNPWQGIEYLIRAAPFVIKENPKTKFLIVGGGKDQLQEKENLISLCKALDRENNVMFTGMVHYEDVSKYINISNICVTPFIKGRVCSPLKLFEFLSCGKPVVSSDIAGVREILNNSKGGILVTPENPEELAKQIIRLLKDKELQERMGRAGRQYVIQNHSWEITARKTVKVFVIIHVLETSRHKHHF